MIPVHLHDLKIWSDVVCAEIKTHPFIIGMTLKFEINGNIHNIMFNIHFTSNDDDEYTTEELSESDHIIDKTNHIIDMSLSFLNDYYFYSYQTDGIMLSPPPPLHLKYLLTNNKKIIQEYIVQIHHICTSMKNNTVLT